MGLHTVSFKATYSDQTAEVAPEGSLVGESSQNSLNLGLGIIVICPELFIVHGFLKAFSCLIFFCSRHGSDLNGATGVLVFGCFNLDEDSMKVLRRAFGSNWIDVSYFEVAWSHEKVQQMGLYHPMSLHNHRLVSAHRMSGRRVRLREFHSVDLNIFRRISKFQRNRLELCSYGLAPASCAIDSRRGNPWYVPEKILRMEPSNKNHGTKWDSLAV